MDKGCGISQVYLATETFFSWGISQDLYSGGTYFKEHWSIMKDLIFVSLFWPLKFKNLPLIYGNVFKGGNGLSEYFSGKGDLFFFF